MRITYVPARAECTRCAARGRRGGWRATPAARGRSHTRASSRWLLRCCFIKESLGRRWSARCTGTCPWRSSWVACCGAAPSASSRRATTTCCAGGRGDVAICDGRQVSALLCVSGLTECINDGARHSGGVPGDPAAPLRRHACIVGIIGPRFKKPERMEYEDMVVTPRQNCARRGYGAGEGARGAEEGGGADWRWRNIWADFYQIPNLPYTEWSARQVSACPPGIRAFSSHFVRLARAAGVFDNQAYARRLQLVIDVLLLEAGARADDEGKMAYVNVIGAGLGVWRMSPHQADVFVVVALHRARRLLRAGRLDRVACVNMAFIKPGKHVAGVFKVDTKGFEGDKQYAPKKLFLKSDSHPNGGVTVQLQSRAPSAELPREHADRLLVLSYAADGNSLPGNEFWLGKLRSSGDSAAACATQISELHNIHINDAIRADRTCIYR